MTDFFDKINEWYLPQPNLFPTPPKPGSLVSAEGLHTQLDQWQENYGFSTETRTSSLGFIVEMLAPWDPNDIVGPTGYGDQRFVRADEPLDYQIRFENDPTATAPVGQVVVTRDLDPDADERSFRVGSLQLGDLVIEAPDDQAFFQTEIDLRAEAGILLRVVAGVDVVNLRVETSLESADGVYLAEVYQAEFTQLADVTDDFLIDYSGMRTNRTDGTEIVDLALTNVSDRILHDRLVLVLENLGPIDVSLASSDGITAGGVPYIDLPGTPAEVPVKVLVYEPLGNFVTQEFAITVTDPNQAPVLNPVGNRRIRPGRTLSFTIFGTDPEGAEVSYYASNLPDGAAFDTETGDFSWTPKSAQSGAHTDLLFAVSDSVRFDYEFVAITVDGTSGTTSAFELPNLANTLTVSATFTNSGPVDEGSEVTVELEGIQNAEGYTFWFDWNAGGVFITADGDIISGLTPQATHAFEDDEDGPFTVKARVMDAFGNYQDFTTSVDVNNVAPDAEVINDGPVDVGYPEDAPATSGQATTSPTIGLSATEVESGTPILVDIADGPGTLGDWVGLFALGDADHQYLDWRYLDAGRRGPASAETAGRIAFDVPLASRQYEVRLFAANSYDRLAISGRFTVFGGDIAPSAAPVVTELRNDTGHSAEDRLTRDTVLAFSWSASADPSGVVGYWWALDDSTPESGGTFTTALSATVLVGGDGSHVFYVRAVDGAGGRIVELDLGSVPGGTIAMLYFDLLGFGDTDARVVIDDVVLISELGTAPVANDDQASGDVGEPIVIDVLDNDEDLEENINPATVAVLVDPEHGAAEVDPLTGTVTYTPDSQYEGPDQFTYRVADTEGNLSNPAMVEIAVNDVNEPPTAVALDRFNLACNLQGLIDAETVDMAVKLYDARRISRVFSVFRAFSGGLLLLIVGHNNHEIRPWRFLRGGCPDGIGQE